MGLIVGIDASRNRSGGARAHLTGVLSEAHPETVGIDRVHLWAHPALLAEVPDRPWLTKHAPPALTGGLVAQLWWQWASLPRDARAAGCRVLWATDAATVCRFAPLVVLSQDLLSYEPGVMALHGWGRDRWRLIALRVVQDAAFRRAARVLFLTRYAAELVQREAGSLSAVDVVPHGVSSAFFGVTRRPWPGVGDPVRVVYVSNAAPYKHQWVVVEALARVRATGVAVRLDLVGGGSGPAQTRLDAAVRRWDPDGTWVRQRGAVPAAALPQCLAEADLFVFASSCENMPVTLVEAMAAGLPIACAARGPMPDLLQDGGTYFDPCDAVSIADAVSTLLSSSDLRDRVAARARALASAYSWRRCADESLTALARVARAASP